MQRTAVFVLIHGPLEGLLTWAYVANELWERDVDVIVPGLFCDPDAGIPYWQQHVNAVRTSLEELSRKDRVILVGHSGAGVLLPAIGAAIRPTVAAYVFVDAALPRDGASRLDLFGSDAEREQFRAAALDGMISPFREESLREAIPDDRVREQFVEELRPVPLAVYEEPIPMRAAQPDAPIAYLGFRESERVYAASIQHAMRKEWPLSQLRGGHFEMVVAPERVAEELLRLASACGVKL